MTEQPTDTTRSGGQPGITDAGIALAVENACRELTAERSALERLL